MPKTYRTRATKNEVCNNFLQNRCFSGTNCCRIHPRHKPRPPNVQVLAGTAYNQENITGNKAAPEDHIVVPLLQDSCRDDDLLQTEVVRKSVVKLPRKCQTLAPLESTISQVCLYSYSTAPLICYTETRTVHYRSDEGEW